MRGDWLLVCVELLAIGCRQLVRLAARIGNRRKGLLATGRRSGVRGFRRELVTGLQLGGQADVGLLGLGDEVGAIVLVRDVLHGAHRHVEFRRKRGELTAGGFVAQLGADTAGRNGETLAKRKDDAGLALGTVSGDVIGDVGEDAFKRIDGEQGHQKLLDFRQVGQRGLLFLFRGVKLGNLREQGSTFDGERIGNNGRRGVGGRHDVFVFSVVGATLRKCLVAWLDVGLA